MSKQNSPNFDNGSFLIDRVYCKVSEFPSGGHIETLIMWVPQDLLVQFLAILCKAGNGSLVVTFPQL